MYFRWRRSTVEGEAGRLCRSGLIPSQLGSKMWERLCGNSTLTLATWQKLAFILEGSADPGTRPTTWPCQDLAMCPGTPPPPPPHHSEP